MTSISPLAQALQEVLGERATVLAKETKFIQRVRAFDGADVAQAMILGWLEEPDLHLEELSQILQRREVTISASGLSQRFSAQAAEFFRRLLEELSSKQLQAEVVEIPLLKQFSAVVLEDSSSMLLPQELASLWPGCGGSPGTSGATLKLFVRWDVLSGQLEGPALTAGRQSDKRSPLPLESLPDGSLSLADLGFWSTGRFVALARPGQGRQKRRYLVTRWQPGVRLWVRHGHELNLRAILPQQVGERLELGVLLGQQARLPLRLCVERVPKQVGDQRRAALRAAAQAQGRTAWEDLLYLADWTIVLTNLPRRMANFEQVLVLVRLRWQIECLFRLWKEHGHLDEWRSKSPWRILCEIYAKLAAMVIQQWLIQRGCWQDPHRSLVKAAQVVRREANRIMVALYEGGLEQTLRSLLRCMQSGCRLNTRAQQPTTSQFLLGAPLVWP